MTNILKNIVTFGAQGRIDKAMERFNSVIYQRDMKHKKLVWQYKMTCEKTNKLKKLEENILIELKKINKINSALSVKSREVMEIYIQSSSHENMNAMVLPEELETFTSEDFLSGVSSSAITATTTAGSAFLLMGDAAVVSTGFIASAIALPALITFGAFSHISASKKIAEVQEAEWRVHKEIEKIDELSINYEYASKRCDEVTNILNKSMKVHKKLYKKAYRAVYPIQILSKLFRTSNINMSDKSMEKIRNLVVSAKTIVAIIEKAK